MQACLYCGRHLWPPARWVLADTIEDVRQREMATALEACDPEAVVEPGTPPAVVLDLARFFRICADRGLGLVGWW